MRKLSYLLSLLVLSIVCGGTAWAYDFDGRSWRASTKVTSLDQIVPGKDYVLKGPGVDVSVLSTNYLCVPYSNGSVGSGNITTDCIYQFEAAGSDADGRARYLLKQKTNGEYLADGSMSLTADKSEAFKFAIGEAHNDTTSTSPNYVYYYNPKDENIAFEDMPLPLFILVDIVDQENYTYLSSWSGGSTFWGYHDSNVWEIYTDIEEVHGFDRLNEWFTKLMTAEPEELFNAGINPGDVSEESMAKLRSAFDRATAEYDKVSHDDAECDQICDDLVAAYNECASSIVLPEAGQYYYITNRTRRSGDAVGTIYCDGSVWAWEYADEDDLNNNPARYAVQLLKGEQEGMFLVKCPNYNKYMTTTPGSYQSLEAVDSVDAVDYEVGHNTGNYFYFHNPGNSAGVHPQEAGFKIVSWDYTDPASQWLFTVVPAEKIAEIEAAAKQTRLNVTLNEVYNEAAATYASSRVYSSAATPDTLYADGNLLTSTDQIFTSPLAVGDGGGIDILLNGRISGSGEFMHTTWSSGTAPDHYHFVGADLKKAVSAITVKFSNRIDGGSRNSYPTQFRVYACNDAQVAADTVADGASWEWVGDMSASLANDTIDETWVASTDFGGKSFRYVRLDVIATGDGATIAPSGGGQAYPYFYISELGIYEATYDPAKSPFSSVPEADGEALTTALHAARQEVIAEKATQPTIDQLQSAYDKFLKSYADPQLARDALAEAQTMLDSARVGTGLAEVTQAAYDALKKAIADNEGKITDVMTLTDLNAVVDALQAACDALAASAVMPETDKYYWIISKGTDMTDAAIGAADNTDGQQLVFGAVTQSEGMPNVFDENTAQHQYEYVWLLEQDADGKQYLHNVGTGFYMNGNTTEEPSTTAEKMEVKIEYGKAGQFNILVLHNDSTESELTYLNNNSSVVTKYYKTDKNSYYEFREADFGDDVFTFVDVQPGTHFLCLPYAVTAASNGVFYTVLGVNDANELVLQEAPSEGIAPGEPFVYQTYEDADPELAEDDFGVDLSLGLVSEGKLTNGVQGVLSGITIENEAGFGILTGSDTVSVTTDDGTYDIANNSAYVTNGLPKVDVEADYVLPINGDITGTAVGIDNVVIVPRDGKIYDLQGRRVSRPGKGIYIVDGKKMIFK